MQLAFFLVLNSISALFCVYFIIHFARKLEVKSKRQVIQLLAIMLLWTIISIADAVAEELVRKLLLTNIGYVAYALIAPCWISFVVSFTAHKRRAKNHFLFVLFALSWTFVLLNWLNPGGLFYRSVSTIEANGFTLLLPKYGIIFWIYCLYSFAVLIGSIPWIVKQTLGKRIRKTHFFLIAVAIMAPAFCNALYVLRINRVDFTSASFWVTCLFLYFLHKKEFFARSPLSHNSIIENMSMGYILMTASFSLLEINNAARKMIHLDENFSSIAVEDIILREWRLNPTIIELGDMLRSLHADDGTINYYRITANKLTAADGESYYYAFFILDETDLHAARKRMQYLERYDEPTGLYNRTYFVDLLEKEILRHKEGDAHVIVLACVQIVNYYHCCNLLGSDIGDILARTVGEVFGNLVRSRDAVCRYSPAEIYLFLRFEKPDYLIARIEDILRTALRELKQPIVIKDKSIEPRLNIGVAFAPKHANTCNGLINAANIALRNIAKFAKTPYSIYHELSAQGLARKLRLESDMQAAIESNQFLLLYQPQVDIRSGLVVGVEALVRWNHPEFGLVSPADFIPIAEENGLIQPLGLWVLRQAIKQQRIWQDMGLKKLRVSVNVSLNQLPNPNFSDEVIEAVKSAGVEPSNLELELTESIALFPEALAHNHLNKLRQHNIRIAMDDFGMGHSSLAFIKDFEPNTIKIDRALSSDITDNQASIAMIRSVKTLCRSLNIETVVEFIEHEAQLKILNDLQCFIVQGYLFSMPLSAGECTRYICRQSHAQPI